MSAPQGATGLDLGIAGRSALVCGSSSGLGEACARALAAAGVEVVLNGRDAGKLEAAAGRLAQATGRTPRFLAADVATVPGREALLDLAGPLDILVTNAGGPPPGDPLQLTEAQWLAALQTNMLSAIFLMGAAVPGMAERGWGRVINITSAAVKAPIAPLGLSNGARAGLTGYVAGLSRHVAGSGVTINNLLPGQFLTERLTSFAKSQAAARGIGVDEMLAEMARNTPTGRLGDPAEFGAWCAFLASAHSGYVTGQNLLLDGGSYPGTL
ncbi:MAG: family oxidoreductase [Phenylobacterium sp.]|nr:family oxidoreductase [Phenylobacterium sp.]